MKLLLIEDERKIARTLKRAFEREGYAVDLCHDGDEGDAMAQTENYDAMIIDRMIPGEFNGVDILKRLRESSNSTPVILLTALSSTEDKTFGLDVGADDYLTKPFAIEELLARIRALLRRPAEVSSSILQYKNLCLDINSRSVKYNNQPINLTLKEFSLLEYLFVNRGRIITKETLMSHVWDFDADILPNTVEAHIKQLRSKIDKPFNIDLIKTKRGVGYYIEK